jgi:ribosomal protein S27AE
MDTEESATTQLNPAAAVFNPDARSQTPPDQRLLVADPDTPRSQAGKRQAKEDPQPEMNADFSETVQNLIRHAGLCFRCGCIRPCAYCPKHPYVGKKHIKKRSEDIIRLYGKSTPPSKSTPAVASSSTGNIQAAESNIRLDPFVDIPPFCSKCKTAGHLATHCPRADCNHCQSEEHIGVYCPKRPQYAFNEIVDADYNKPWH